MFLKGFKEAIGIAVLLVSVYLLLNIVVVSAALYQAFTHPELLSDWKSAIFDTKMSLGSFQIAGLIAVVSLSILSFPRLALGLSGFETGVAVMPLVQSPNRIGNTRKLLMTAALIMSVLLIGSSIATSVIIPKKEFCPSVDCGALESEGHRIPEYCACTNFEIETGAVKEAGSANGRALAFIAHSTFGDIATIYDLSTILILWFAGASAMAGLLNIVPRYLPRYGMAPEWARAVRPLVLVFTAICFAVTVIFKADVDAQGGAYATGVLVLMSSAAVAVSISARRRSSNFTWAFYVIAAVFIYTTLTNIFERPDGIKIASFFIFSIIATSFISRALRSTEIRISGIELDDAARRFIEEADTEGEIRIVTNRRETGDMAEYRFKEHEKRIDNHIPSSDPVLFYEIETGDASEFKGKIKIRGIDIEGYRILRTQAPAVPNAIAAFLLYLRDSTGKIPHVYFGWSEGNPIMYLARYILFGEGDTAPVTREILRQAESDPELRPNVHVGG